MVKNLPANAGGTGDVGLILGSGRSPGGGHGNPLQCSCLENPMDREAWWAIWSIRVSESDMTKHTHTYYWQSKDTHKDSCNYFKSTPPLCKII